MLAIAPTQSGKTTGLAIPNILEWQGPVIALSVKTDLLRDTLERRGTMGTRRGLRPDRASPASTRPRAGRRCSAAGPGPAPGGSRDRSPTAPAGKRSLADGDFWFSAAAKLLAPLLFAAATAGLTMDTVVEWIDTQEETDVLDALEAADDPERARTPTGRPGRATSASARRSTRPPRPCSRPTPTPASSSTRGSPDIESRWLLDGGAHTLYLCASGREQRRLRPVFVALLEEMIEAAYVESGIRGAPLDPPLLIVLDEVANIAPLPDLDVLASTAAGHGIQLITILQDLAQAHDRWGRERAETIVNNHRGKLLGAGLTDERALAWASRLLGDAELTQLRPWFDEPL